MSTGGIGYHSGESARVPADDCPPYDPTLWKGRDCFYLSKLLESQVVRDELTLRGWGGDLNGVVSNTGNLYEGRRAYSSQGLPGPSPTPDEHLASSRRGVFGRAAVALKSALTYVGLSTSPAPDQADATATFAPALAPVPPRGRWSTVGIRDLLWTLAGFGAPTDHFGINTAPPPIAVTPTDGLHERLHVALSVGDTLAAAQIAAELARRRATIQQQPAEGPVTGQAGIDPSSIGNRVGGRYTAYWN